MRQLIQPEAAQCAESGSVYHDGKAVAYHYANDTLQKRVFSFTLKLLVLVVVTLLWDIR